VIGQQVVSVFISRKGAKAQSGNHNGHQGHKAKMRSGIRTSFFVFFVLFVASKD
jgi:hypothetical protein